MRKVLSAALALSMISGAALAAAPPPEAEPTLDMVKQLARSKSITFRKVKVAADGKVCGTASLGGDSDTEFMADLSAQTVWLNEAPDLPANQTAFGYGPNVLRSTERSAYLQWKACQSGK
jgi:hypothetical protein